MSAEELARQQTAAGTRPAAGGIQRLPTPAGEKYVRTSRTSAPRGLSVAPAARPLPAAAAPVTSNVPI